MSEFGIDKNGLFFKSLSGDGAASHLIAETVLNVLHALPTKAETDFMAILGVLLGMLLKKVEVVLDDSEESLKKKKEFVKNIQDAIEREVTKFFFKNKKSTNDSH